MVRRRCRRPGAGAPRQSRRVNPPRQAQAYVRATPRRRRSRGRHQRREDPPHGTETQGQALSLALRLHRWPAGSSRRDDAPNAPGARHRVGRPGDAAEDPARTGHGEEAEGVPRRCTPAPGTAADRDAEWVRQGAHQIGGSLMAAVLDRFYGTGRRKTSVARVWIRPGAGRIAVNRRAFEDYFPRETLRMIIEQPLQVTGTAGQLDITVTVGGGGPTGQAGAVRHGLARALARLDEKFRLPLKKAGLLTRDPRMRERKKYGQPGARQKFQYSKR